MAAREQWNDGMTVRLPLPVRRGESPCRLLTIRLSVTALAAERELERTTPASGSTDFTGPWRWRKKTSWARHVSGPAFGTSPFPEGSRSQETRPSIPDP